jgi:hypothetical protein
MSNDGHGHLIDIPSVFISSFDGEKIIKTYKNCQNSLIFKIYFDVYTSDVVNITFWLDVTHRESFITIRDFYRDYYDVIKKYLDVSVKYDIYFIFRYKINQNCGI